jgi:hypothetical protein
MLYVKTGTFKVLKLMSTIHYQKQVETSMQKMKIKVVIIKRR